MSYCRFSDDSDVYLFPTDEGITCHDCALNPDRNPWFDLPAEALNHLYNHREAGHKVPQKAIDRLIQEMEETLLALSPADQSLALYLLEQARGLRKVCPACKGKKGANLLNVGEYDEELMWVKCSKCHGTGFLPVSKDDVIVKLKEE